MALKILWPALIILFLSTAAAGARGVQKELGTVGLMPDLPAPLAVRDWAQVALQFDQLVFDFEAAGLYLPLIQWDKTRPNVRLDSFFLPAYVGDYRQRPGDQEALTTLGAVLGASLVGVDKSDQKGQNWVLTQKQFFNHSSGANRILNHTRVSPPAAAPSWYDLFPAMLFFMLADQYPQTAAVETALTEAGQAVSMAEIMHSTALYYLAEAEKWETASIEKEPDVLAGAAWLLYMAYRKFGTEKFLAGALHCLQRLALWEQNPFYEVLLPYGAFLASRLNAEENTSFNVQKLLDWCFGPSKARPGWGVLKESWGDYGVHGLVGSLTDGGGYAFALNSFHFAAALAPLPRYDSRYARDVGKLLLNLSNSARLFYPSYLPPDHQSSAVWAEEFQNAVAYEGLRRQSGGKIPYAQGDALRWGWAASDYALYGAAHVGFLGAVVEKTNQPGILKIDLLATDHFRAPAYPTFLFYNPHSEAKIIELAVGPNPVDLWDTVAKEFLKKNQRGRITFRVRPQAAAVVVLVPAAGQIEFAENKMLANGVIVDYGVNQMAIKTPRPGQRISAAALLELEFTAPSNFVPKDVRAWLGGEPLAVAPAPSGWAWDGGDFPPGEYDLAVKVKSEGGIVLADHLSVVVERGILGPAGAHDLAAWEQLTGASAEVKLLGKMIAIKHIDSLPAPAGIKSPFLNLDLARKPVLTMDRVQLQGSGFIELLFQKHGICSDIKLKPPADRPAVWDLRQVLGSETGLGRLQIRICLDQPGSSVFLFRRGIDLYYQEAAGRDPN